MQLRVSTAYSLNHVGVYTWDGGNMQVAKRIPTAKTPRHMWIDSKSTTAFVTMQDSDELVAIDLVTQAVKWRTKTGAMPADVYGTADDRHLLVGLTGADLVEVWDVSGKEPRKVNQIQTGQGAHAFRGAGHGRQFCVS